MFVVVYFSNSFAAAPFELPHETKNARNEGDGVEKVYAEKKMCSGNF